MPSRPRPFAQVDVFSAQPCGGNPVAVVLDAEGWEDEELRRVARWTNLSETTFVLPPTQPGADYRVRILTPTTEFPFAGHPTLGTCHAWLEAVGEPGREHVVQECAAGLIAIRRTPDGLAFAAPPLLRSGPVEEALLDEIAAALGVARGDIVDAAWADNGPGWAAVLLGSVDAVLALRPGPLPVDVGVAALTAAGEDPDGAALEVRAFCRDGDGQGVLEDPVTGSLNASLAGWLLGAARLRAPYLARQGTVLGRSGRIHITQDEDGGVWVGGATTTVVTGTVAI
ncbi:PhzF family phenazine biosynthesis protein [Paraconexibacter antarcticus]|uniref:PhzF family phenazine biosynthesis protein n=1 Tax=Paraconexibacter antarcticus TaxID=2949664 RepID=A0ABY5DPV4_9ACTN|nr:PhzF family phenazine biosynthesis protein [Paraconexibacter antarcticus]UTI63649.1 PhzF family phenazine biosynthesis protein [Paraconexibacter antarcticus]